MKKRMTSGRIWDRRKPLPSSVRISPGRVALIPASELDNLPMWNQRAKALQRADLVVVPANNPRLERTVQRIKVTMSKHGRPVIITRVH